MKLLAHRPELPGNVISFLIVLLYPFNCAPLPHLKGGVYRVLTGQFPLEKWSRYMVI